MSEHWEREEHPAQAEVHEPLEAPYDWATDWEGSVDVEVRVRCDNFAHARYVASELEDRVNQLNAEFLETVMEPT
jgi:hypothetical protein